MNKLYLTTNGYGYWHWRLGNKKGNAKVSAQAARDDAEKYAREHNMVLAWDAKSFSASWWLKTVTLSKVS